MSVLKWNGVRVNQVAWRTGAWYNRTVRLASVTLHPRVSKTVTVLPPGSARRSDSALLLFVCRTTTRL